MDKILTDRTEIKVRFGEVDSMGIVWHGNYVKYIEEGRESFGHRYGISYLDFHAHDLMTPVVSMEFKYKKQVRYGDRLIVETEYIDDEAARMKFRFRIFRKSDNELVATAETTQVFLNGKGEMLLYPPDFIMEWKRKLGLMKVAV